MLNQPRTLIIHTRFRGPPASGNGGYVCGLLGECFDAPAEVTLHRPPPLETELDLRPDGDSLILWARDERIATASPVHLELELPDPVGWDDAREASRHYPGFAGHPFPDCFVCGPGRDEGDGLRIFPGPLPGRELAAAPWIPHDNVCDSDGFVITACVWAALDCPSYFGIHAKTGRAPFALLGRLGARIDRKPRLGEPCVAVGWVRKIDGRKSHTASALLGEDGTWLAWARSTWIDLKTS